MARVGITDVLYRQHCADSVVEIGQTPECLDTLSDLRLGHQTKCCDIIRYGLLKGLVRLVEQIWALLESMNGAVNNEDEWENKSRLRGSEAWWTCIVSGVSLVEAASPVLSSRPSKQSISLI